MKRDVKNVNSNETLMTPVSADDITQNEEEITKKTEKQEKTIQDVNEDEFTSEVRDNEEVSNEVSEIQDTKEVTNKLTDMAAALSEQNSDGSDLKEAKEKNRKKPSKKLLIGVFAVLLSIVGLSSFLIGTATGKQLLKGIGINIGGKLWETMTNDFEEEKPSAIKVKDTDDIEEEDEKSNAPEINPDTIKWPEHQGSGVKVDGIYNILLIGEEAIGSSTGKGRTDVIVIATLDTLEKKVKLTSLMRDCFVQIPGFQDNKLNSAYEKGGIDLLYKTIALNFDVHLDGCVKVNFKNFEKIINKLGGIDITLTKDEAHYLNTTNYISIKKYRNVVEGKQHMNGNQVLGYSRVRKRATITGNNNDYGRTDRHRIVLNAIFEKYKSKSKVELASLMFSILPMITTDIDSKCFETMLNSYIMMGTTKLEQQRIPANGTFQDNLKVRGMSVLILDFDKNRNIIHNFIFGDNIRYSNKSSEEEAEPSVTGTEKISGDSSVKNE